MVASASKVTLLSVTAEVIPSPPVNVRVSLNIAIASVPVSPAILRLVATLTVPAAVS